MQTSCEPPSTMCGNCLLLCSQLGVVANHHVPCSPLLLSMEVLVHWYGQATQNTIAGSQVPALPGSFLKGTDGCTANCHPLSLPF